MGRQLQLVSTKHTALKTVKGTRSSIEHSKEASAWKNVM